MYIAKLTSPSRTNIRDESALEYGRYLLVDISTNAVAAHNGYGEPWLTLEEIEDWLTSSD